MVKKTQIPKIRQVPNKYMLDYIGMNPASAKILGFKKIKKGEILIDKNMPFAKKVKTVLHEVTEMHNIAKGETYWKAHTEATKAEKSKSKVNKMAKLLKDKI